MKRLASGHTARSGQHWAGCQDSRGPAARRPQGGAWSSLAEQAACPAQEAKVLGVGAALRLKAAPWPSAQGRWAQWPWGQPTTPFPDSSTCRPDSDRGRIHAGQHHILLGPSTDTAPVVTKRRVKGTVPKALRAGRRQRTDSSWPSSLRSTD